MTTEQLLKKIKSDLAWKKLCHSMVSNLYLDRINYQKLRYHLGEEAVLNARGNIVYLRLEVFEVAVSEQHIFVG